MCTFVNVHLLILVTTTSSTMTLQTGDVKLISSPHWPGGYPYYTYRSFTVYAPQYSVVKLEVLYLHLRSSCSYDTLTIYDGKTVHLIRYKLFSIKYNVPKHRNDKITLINITIFNNQLVCEGSVKAMQLSGAVVIVSWMKQFI